VKFAGYEHVREISRDTRYAVYRASRIGDGAPVVVKTPAAEFPTANQAATQLRREYEFLSGLDVPGVAKPIGLEEDAGMPALIIEDAGSQTLKEWLRTTAFQTDTFLSMAIEIAEILARLHAKDLIHRDVNPSNIVVGADLRPTLVDFEAATTISGLGPLGGVPAELECTLRYMAPEQTGRMNRLVDHRTDLYSLGATYYEMLTGAPPFLSDDPVELVHAHLARAPIPPAQIDLAVPPSLSDIVLKLLAKVPEKRYQTAEALVADLREAQRQFKATGIIAPFELDLLDLARDLPLPEKLYGRGRELAELESALDAAYAGKRELLLVTGAAGVGKSALVERLHATVLERRGRFLAGKFDSRLGNTPYAPVADAFRSLIVTLLGESETTVATWQHRIRTAVGSSGRVLTAMIPELERLIGEQPAVPELGPVETENRFRLVFQAFVQAFSTSDQPLVLFVDDLQWADAASLTLLRSLATTADLSYLLLIGAFRPVGSDHPLRRSLTALREGGAVPREIALRELDIDGATALCCDALRCDPVRGRPLAELIVQKTAGNPFFMRKLLRFLHQAGLLVFDAAFGTWEWDLARIERVGVTDNVADLLVTVLRKLPEPTQKVLEVAACIGNKVPLELVAAVQEQSLETTARRIWLAVQEGLLVPLDAPESAVASGPRYQFAHDRVQQAAYSLLTEDERDALHLLVGRRRCEGLGEHELSEHIFEVVDQLNLGARLVLEQGERNRCADLNFRAARKAKASSAYGASLAYLKRAIAFLPADAWQSWHQFAFLLHKDAVECAHVTGDRTLAQELFEDAWTHAESQLEQADLCDVRLVACSVEGAYAEAIRWGRDGLSRLGLELPASRVWEAVVTEVGAMQAHLAGRAIDELLDAPKMEGPQELAAMRILSNLLEPTYVTWQKLFAFVVARMVTLSLVHGNAVSSASAYAVYAMFLCSMTGDFATAHAFGRLAVDLSRRFEDPIQQCRAAGVFGTFVNVWRAPLRSNMPVLRAAVAKGLESGDVQYVNHLNHAIVAQLLYEGVELPKILSEVEASRTLARKTDVQLGFAWQLPYRQAIRCLEGLTRGRNSFEDAEVDERELMTPIEKDPYLAFFYEVLRLQTSYLFGDLDLARKMSASTANRFRSARGFVPTGLPVVEHNVYTSLTLAACCDARAPTDRQDLLAQIEDNQQKLAGWMENCPDNFQHRHVLVAAEVARLTGRPQDAASLYDQSIEAARRERSIKDEAIAKELAGRFYRALDRKPIAALYLSAAIQTYERWGARAKAAALEQEFPDLESAEALLWRHPITPARDEKGGMALDLLGVLKAAETISSEVVLDRLLEKLMHVCLATAGAERGALLIEEDGKLLVRVVGSATERVSLEHRPLETSEDVPRTAIEHVRTTGDILVLADAVRQGTFASDPYIAKHAVRSSLVLPIRRQATLVGLLYLENNLAPSLFTPDRVGVLQLLSSQIAISIEIGILFERLTAEVEERKRAEALVRFLAEAGATLVESLDYHATLTLVARLAVPFLADWCVVDLLESGKKIERVGASHADPTKAGLLRELGERYPPEWNSTEPWSTVIRTARPLLVDEVTEATLSGYGRGAENVRILRELGTRTLLAVPLMARGQILGAISFVSGRPECHYGARDLALAEELARRAAGAIDNATLYRNAQQAIRSRDEFLSTASHELRTPVTSLQLVIQNLLRRPHEEHFSASRMLAVADQQTQRLSALIDELLDVTRTASGELTLAPEDFDLVAATRHVLERTKTQIERSKSDVTLHGDQPILGRWDRTRVDQLLTHLLSNALTYGAGKPIDIQLERAGAQARIVVSDHGIGISADRLPHIFDRFERATSVRHYGGLGLGLFIARQIVEAHHGSISVQSQPGVGSTFTIDLPLGPREEPVQGPTATPL
jgi:predicted ATPase/signal transduction histidine kinase